MATVTKKLLSGSTNGKSIQIAATATLGNTIHTAVSGTSSWDEIYLYAVNTSASTVNLTLEYGAAGTANNIVIAIPPTGSGLIQICPGLLLNNSLVLTAFAGTTNVINVFGFVNNIV